MDEWWQNDAVQNARKVFIDKFAQLVDNWPQKYFAALQQLAKAFEAEEALNTEFLIFI